VIQDVFESKVMLRVPSFAPRSKCVAELPNLATIAGKPGDADFDLNWTMTTMFCREHYIGEEASCVTRKNLKLTKLREMTDFMEAGGISALNESHVQDLVDMIRSCVVRRLWELDAKVLWGDAGEIKQLEDPEHAELAVVYRILISAAKVPVFWEVADFAFVLSLLPNLRSPDAAERRAVGSFLSEYVKQKPEDRERLLRHLVVNLSEITQSVGPPCVANFLSLVREFGNNERELVIAHVLPLLGNPGLGFYVDVLLPWLYALSTERAFREVLLDALIRGFPLTNRKSAMTYLKVLGVVAVQVPPRLVQRLLGVVAMCIAREDDETNAAALAVLPKFGRIIDEAELEAATPMLETLVVGWERHGQTRSAKACWKALKVVAERRGPLVKEFACQFCDREAGLRGQWEGIGKAAKATGFSTRELASDPTAVRVATRDRKELEKIVSLCQ
jgi:hypothetical protein